MKYVGWQIGVSYQCPAPEGLTQAYVHELLRQVHSEGMNLISFMMVSCELNDPLHDGYVWPVRNQLVEVFESSEDIPFVLHMDVRDRPTANYNVPRKTPEYIEQMCCWIARHQRDNLLGVMFFNEVSASQKNKGNRSRVVCSVVHAVLCVFPVSKRQETAAATPCIRNSGLSWL